MDHEANLYPPICDYAVIGNCHTAALVSKNGSIDWYPPSRFDAPAAFCRVLDANTGGFLSIAPVGRFTATRRYRGRTALLETTFTDDGGSVRLTDLMPVHRRQPERQGYEVGSSHQILRMIEGTGGTVYLEIRFKPTLNYARAETSSTVVSDTGIVALAEGQYLILAAPGITFDRDGSGALVGHIVVQQGARRWLTLSTAPDEKQARAALKVVGQEEDVRETERFWEDWAAHCTYRGPYEDVVYRSAITLKLLTYEPSGAIIAAPTTSLPEVIGGDRNWDYCYTWLRDSALTLYALMTVGYEAEATDFFHWLEQTGDCAPGRRPKIAYTIDGGLVPPETILTHLSGYRQSQPVRVGNAAARQTQMDIFGELMSAANLHIRLGQRERPVVPRIWPMLANLVEQAANGWQTPDGGIWEFRGQAREFLYSKLMCWVAVDRGIRLAEDFGLPAPLARWRKVRDNVRQSILRHGFNKQLGAFTQCFGGSNLDASALAIPQVGFLPATDPRVLSTIDKIRTHLSHDGFVYRYLNDDSLPGREATFALSSFWLVDALALSGQVDSAREHFDRVIKCANDVGLLSEEINPTNGELLGNFPQGFTHLALIRSAVNLARAATHGPEHHAHTEAERASDARHAAS